MVLGLQPHFFATVIIRRPLHLPIWIKKSLYTNSKVHGNARLVGFIGIDVVSASRTVKRNDLTRLCNDGVVVFCQMLGFAIEIYTRLFPVGKGNPKVQFAVLLQESGQVVL